MKNNKDQNKKNSPLEGFTTPLNQEEQNKITLDILTTTVAVIRSNMEQDFPEEPPKKKSKKDK